ncbi:hypothetical protein IMSAGC007_01049 [Lachnospiraceae bacterium]|nr:hypothetical protein IMSAGC007_01049 [Lachnospiraceae bacterium]
MSKVIEFRPKGNNTETNKKLNLIMTYQTLKWFGKGSTKRIMQRNGMRGTQGQQIII